MDFQLIALLIYFGGIVLWFLFWRVLVGFDRTRKNRLLYLPLLGCVLVLLINAVLALIAEIPEYGVEIGIYGFVERNATTIATFTLGIAVFVVLTFEKTANMLDREESREFLLLVFSSFVLSIMGVLPLYWVPQVFGWLTTLRHLKTVPYTYSLFLLAAAMLIYLHEILGSQKRDQ
jgi:hypothetical protein